jgi:hypothetical protein
MIALPRAGVSLHLLDDAGMLFNEPAQRLYRLNPTATALWCLMAGGLTQSELVPAVAEHLGTSTAVARRWTSSMVRQWRRHGLLAEGPIPTGVRRPNGDDRLASVAPAPRHRRSIHSRRRYRTTAGTLTLGFGSRALAELVHPVLAHLEVEPGGIETSAEIVAGATGYELRAAGSQVGTCRTLEEAASLVKACLPALVLPCMSYLVAVHAAALARPNGCVLLPAPAGHGKTTLAMALMAAGWCYLSDDLVLLDRASQRAIPMPFSLALKEGAWPTAVRYFPEVDRAAIHIRADGRRVRYLLPVDWTLTPTEVRWIVFPRYQPGVATLQPLARAAALDQLFQCCSAIPVALTADDVQRLMAWIDARQCFALAVSDLDQAIAQLNALSDVTSTRKHRRSRTE